MTHCRPYLTEYETDVGAHPCLHRDTKNDLITQLAYLDMEFIANNRGWDFLENTIAPILSLPSEILIKIFHINEQTPTLYH